jgi:phosphatidylserine/phosphatidylglycerophosphate/cardiolipin synthase-like enzyme
MRNIIAAVLLFALSASAETNMQYKVVAPKVYFSPAFGGGSCESNLVSEIGKAKKTIQVEAYQFTLQSVADALLKAKKKGVDVNMVVDNLAVEGRNSKVGYCASNGIPVVVDRKHNIFHNKVMIIDKKTVITGSFNFTANAEFHNAENMWVIADTNAAALCVSNWMIHAAHSVPLK